MSADPNAEWPHPFSGISNGMWFPNERVFRKAVNALLECGHLHNYAVQADGQIIYTTDYGIECLRAAT